MIDYPEPPEGFNMTHFVGFSEVVNAHPSSIAVSGFIGVSPTQCQLSLLVVRDVTVYPGEVGLLVLFVK